MKILNPYKICIDNKHSYQFFETMMSSFVEILKDYIVIENRKNADFIINDHNNNYIFDQTVKPLPIKWSEFYTYYIPKKEFNQSIFDSAYKMLTSDDLDSMKLGANLLFLMERPSNGNELCKEIRKINQFNTVDDLNYYLKTIMIAHNYED